MRSLPSRPSVGSRRRPSDSRIPTEPAHALCQRNGPQARSHRERYRLTGDSDEAVAHGVGTTARLITGAALIIIAVFWGFAMGDLIMFQQMGFGVAVALLIDATIVRSVLVPATMKLLGTWNWYLPSWLGWLPDVHVEGAQPPPTAEPRPVPGGS